MSLFSTCERAVCSVRAISSSVDLLWRFANCRGSNELGSAEQMKSPTSLSKHLLTMGVSASYLPHSPRIVKLLFRSVPELTFGCFICLPELVICVFVVTEAKAVFCAASVVQTTLLIHGFYLFHRVNR